MERDVLLGEGEDMDSSNDGNSSDDIRDKEMIDREHDCAEPPRKRECVLIVKVSALYNIVLQALVFEADLVLFREPKVCCRPFGGTD